MKSIKVAIIGLVLFFMRSNLSAQELKVHILDTEQQIQSTEKYEGEVQCQLEGTKAHIQFEDLTKRFHLKVAIPFLKDLITVTGHLNLSSKHLLEITDEFSNKWEMSELSSCNVSYLHKDNKLQVSVRCVDLESKGSGSLFRLNFYLDSKTPLSCDLMGQ